GRRVFRVQPAPRGPLPRWRYVIAAAMAAAAFVALALTAAFDRKIAAIFIVAAVTVFGLLRLIASLVMVLARRMPRTRSTILRLAISNIFRPGALTPTVMMSLGLGLVLLVAILEVDVNLSRQF